MPETAVLFGKNSDIGKALAERLVRDGWDVLRIGREESFPMPPPWDLYISAVGTVEPIGPFFGLDFEEWQGSFIANSLLQLSVLHAIWPYRRKDKVVDAMFMAGGGTNGPFTNYSAYAAAKITLIKMCELIDDEEAGINAFIIGPGFVNTKIHQQTVKAGPDSRTACETIHTSTDCGGMDRNKGATCTMIPNMRLLPRRDRPSNL